MPYDKKALIAGIALGRQLKGWATGGGGGGGIIEPLTITENGVYRPPAGVSGYAPITVSVPRNPSPSEPGEGAGNYYYSDGTLTMHNYQSEVEKNYLLITEGVKYCLLYNGTGTLYVYAASTSPVAVADFYHTTSQSPDEPVFESHGAKGTKVVDGVTYYYAYEYWYSPPPTPVLNTNQCSDLNSADVRLSEALYYMFGVGGSALLGTKYIYRDGIYYAADDNFSGYSMVIVDTHTTPSLPPEYEALQYLVCDKNQVALISCNLISGDTLTFKATITGDFDTMQTIVGARSYAASARWDYTYEVLSGTPTFQPSNNCAVVSQQVTDTYTITCTLKLTGSSTTRFGYGQYDYTSYKAPVTGNLYELAVKDGRFGNELIHLIPCRRLADSVCGFYDLWGSRFIQSSGKQPFLPGPVVG